MTVAGGLALYFVIWWVVLFTVLPFGVRSQAEMNSVEQGTEPGAPVLPGLLRKALITSVLAAIVFAVVWYLWVRYEF